ncbi:DNA ligase [Salmonella phage SPLA5a]|nr:DNA ligase [Salmonella phage SPLA5a]
MATKSTVRLVEFKMSESKKADVEEALAELLDNGFTIAAQHEADGYLTFTLVKSQFGINMLINGEDDGGQTPAHQYQVVNGSVERVLH